MSMNRNMLLIVSMLALCVSCEKVWEADLREKALDTIRGYYELESAIWEGTDPVDLDGDGTASYDYFKEWSRIPVGVGYFGPALSNDGGYIDVPYITDGNASWGGPVELTRKVVKLKVVIDVVIDGNQSRLDISLPDNPDTLFEHTGYGEFKISRIMTCSTQDEIGQVREVSGPVTFRFKRTKYKIE